MHPREEPDQQFQIDVSVLAARWRIIGLALLLARPRVGSRLFTGFFLAHVVTHGATDRGAGDTVFAGNVTGDTADDGAFQAARLRDGGNGRHRQQEREGQGSGADFHDHAFKSSGET